jgi:alkyl sulfatase BDS1-like metallo-beta-lactamase superfamily hydrolase
MSDSRSLKRIGPDVQPSPDQPQASEHTRRANRAAATTLPFNDREDFQLAARRLIEEVENLVILNRQGQPAWDVRPYRAMAEQEAPDVTHPGL